MSEDNETTEPMPSVHEANKVLRVLNCERLKYTYRLYRPDGKIIEWQSNEKCKLDWDAEARSLFLKSGEYSSPPIMKWDEGFILLTEENEVKK